MSHAVHYRDADGGVQLEEASSQEAALELVERLRNDGDVTDVRVFREVPIEVRTYYKVVVAGDAASDGAVVETSDDGPPSRADVPGRPLSEVTGVPADLEVPSGAVVMSPPPVAPSENPDAERPDELEIASAEPRRQLFSRG